MLRAICLLSIIMILYGCSAREEQKLPAPVVLKESENTMDGDDLRDRVRSSDVKLMFTDKSGTKRVEATNFKPGDRLYVKVDDMKEHIPFDNYTLGVTPLSGNVKITRLDKTFFQIDIDRKTTDPTFQMEVYLYSDEVLFDDAFHDTIDGYDNDKTGHSIALLGYAFPIVK